MDSEDLKGFVLDDFIVYFIGQNVVDVEINDLFELVGEQND